MITTISLSKRTVVLLGALSTLVPTMSRADNYIWTARTDAGARNWTDVASSSNGQYLAASAYNAYIYTSSDGGATWTERTTAGARAWDQVAISDDGAKLIAAPHTGYLYTSSDGGVTWTERTGAGSRQWEGLASSADGTKYVATAFIGYIYTSTDSGANWTERTGAGSRAWAEVDCSPDGTEIAVVASGNYVYTSGDSGATWTTISACGAENWVPLAAAPDLSTIIIADWGGYVTASTDSGANWTLHSSLGSFFWGGVGCSANGSILLAVPASASSYIRTSRNGGATWALENGAGSRGWSGVATSADAATAIACCTGYIYTGVLAETTPTVTTDAITDVTFDSATCGGEVTDDGGASVTARGVCWSTSSNPTIADDKTVDGTGSGAFTSAITGLDPGTTYHARAYATNSEGTSYGADVEFTTGMSVTASGGSAAYSIGGAAAAVDPGLALIAGDITNFRVSITGNFASGDVLDFAGTLPSGVTDSYDGGTGILSFTGTASTADWQALLRTVTFETSSGSTATRTIAFTAGGAIPSEATGHFYEFVSSASINWTDSRDAAAARTLFGLQGYLATITSQEENDFIRQKLGADAWIGGSDADVEGEWRWVTGPEAGTQFSNDSTPVGGQFANWNTGEPNNSGGNEHYAEIYSTDGVGKWNDLPNSFGLSGYVAEYGGSLGDPPTTISADRDVIVSTRPTVTTSAVIDVDANTATSGGDVSDNGGASVTTRGVCWNTSGTPTIADYITEDGNGTGSFTSAITGLAPATTYYVRAYATNTVGTAYGGEEEFTTDATTPTVTTAAIADVTATAASGGGDVTAGGGAAVTARGVCWNTTGTPTVADGFTEDGTGTGSFNSEITGLSPGTMYYVRAYAENSQGISYGAEVTFTAGAILPTVTTAAVGDVEETTAASGGEVTDTGGGTINTRGVCWNSSGTPTIANDRTTDGSGLGTFTSQLMDLDPNTQYFVCAYATNSAGTAYGNEVTFRTDEVEVPDEDPPVNDVPTLPDLRMWITVPSEEAEVGDDLVFEVDVENVGGGDATNVVVRVALPESTEFVAARWRTPESAQSAPLDAYVDGEEIVLDLGDVPAEEAVNVELILRAVAKGSVTLIASVACDDIAISAPVNSDQSVEVSDVYWEVVNTIVPLNACGWLGVVPAVTLFGLLSVRRHSYRPR